MVDRALITKKINLINHSLQRIEKYKQVSFEEFIGSEDIRDIVVHNLFIALQYLIDIGTHIIADEGFEEISYLSDIPEILSKEKVISQEMVKPIKMMMGFRNLLAHQYGDLDMKIVYNVMQNSLKDIYLYVQKVIEYCRL